MSYELTLLGEASEQGIKNVMTRLGLTIACERKRSRPEPADACRLELVVSPSDEPALAAAAGARGLTVAALATAIVHATVHDALIDAVLDDSS
jgi:hypothetical protein